MPSRIINQGTLVANELIKFELSEPATIKVTGISFTMNLMAVSIGTRRSQDPESVDDADFDEMTPTVQFLKPATDQRGNYQHSIQPGIYALRVVDSVGSITVSRM